MAIILVVDDRAAIRSELGLMLERGGYKVELGKNGAEAIELYRLIRPDVVLMDLFMPVINGFDALFFLRQDYPDARVVAMSDGRGQMGIDALSEARALGAQRTLTKPMRQRELLTTIGELLEE